MGLSAERNQEDIGRMEEVLKIYEKPLAERSPWSVWMRSLECCMPMSARRGRCAQDGLLGTIRQSQRQRHGQRLLRRGTHWSLTRRRTIDWAGGRDTSSVLST